MKSDQKLITFMMSNRKKTTYLLISDIKMKIKIFDMSKLKKNHFLSHSWKGKKNHKFHHVNLEKEVVSQLFIEIKLKIMNFIVSKFQKN